MKTTKKTPNPEEQREFDEMGLCTIKATRRGRRELRAIISIPKIKKR